MTSRSGHHRTARPAVRLGSVSLRDNLPEAWRSRRIGRPPKRAAGGVTPNEPNTNRLGRLEAVLWLAEKPLTLRMLARAAGLAGVPEARELVQALRDRLARRRSGLDLVEIAGGVRMLTRPFLAPWIEKLAGEAETDGFNLSTPAMETLAIVAHQQPMVRAEVEAIRGVGCGELLRQLLEADLLRIVGRSEELGKPLLYGTTDRFLEVFGLRNLEGLPEPVEGAGIAGPTKQNAPSRQVETGAPSAS